MSTLIEFLKRFPRIKMIGQRALKLRGLYFKLTTDDEFFAAYAKKYLEVPGCRDNYDESLYDQYINRNLHIISKPLVTYYDELWSIIEEKIRKKEAYTIMRVGDGEANFLRGIIKGNTAKRHLTNGKAPTKEYLGRFKRTLLDNDSIHVQMYKGDFKTFRNRYEQELKIL